MYYLSFSKSEHKNCKINNENVYFSDILRYLTYKINLFGSKNAFHFLKDTSFQPHDNFYHKRG